MEPLQIAQQSILRFDCGGGFYDAVSMGSVGNQHGAVDFPGGTQIHHIPVSGIHGAAQLITVDKSAKGDILCAKGLLFRKKANMPSDQNLLCLCHTEGTKQRRFLL